MATSEEILLGGLLHDIGKFMQRAHPPGHQFPTATENMRQLVCPFNRRTGRFTHEHALWTQAFFDTVSVSWPKGINGSTVIALARSHHNPSSVEETVIQQADWLSAGLDRPPEDTDSTPRAFRSVPLLSVFESLGGRGTHGFAHNLLPLGDDLTQAFPVPREEEPSDLTKDYAQLWSGFCEDIVSMEAESTPAFVSALSAALHRHAWCIPASTQQLADVSLYDHLKSTAAIAAALHRTCVERSTLDESNVRSPTEPRYILLAGDLSGIQQYLFDIAEVGVGGTARRLRARSFYLGLLADTAAMKTLNAFGMTPINLLMCSGGRFTLLLPNLADASQRITGLRASLDEWLHRYLQAQIRINIAEIVASGNDFRAGVFSRTLAKLEERLQQAKHKPMSTVLQEDGKWSESAFVPGSVAADRTYRPCGYCGRLPAAPTAERNRPICEFCDQDVKLGRQLPGAYAVAFYDDEALGDFKVAGLSFGILGRGQPLPDNAQWAYSINDPAGPLSARRIPMWPKFLANAIPHAGESGCEDCPAQEKCNEEERPRPGAALTFACLSRLSLGREALGYLKGDVDHLGRTFAFGFREELRSLSRLATLSRMLDLFFSGYVHQLLDREFKDVYTVYSGGDDFLLIGPWNRMIELAEKLNADFARFTCGRLTFSAGFTLVGAGMPVATAAPLADVCLERAKEQVPPGSDSSRDQIHAFSTTLKWQRFPAAMMDAHALTRWLDDKVVPISAARRFLVYAELWRRYRESGETAALRFVPLLSYDLARNWPTSPDRDSASHAARQWAARFRNVEEGAFQHLRLVLEYALNAQR